MVLIRVIKKNNYYDNEYIVMPRKDIRDYDILNKALKRTGKTVKFLLFDRNSRKLYLQNMNNIFGRLTREKITPEDISTDRINGNFLDDNDTQISSIYHGYGKKLGERFQQYCQEMMIKDHAIKAENNYMWDFDKFYLGPDGRVIYFEIKHKFPTYNLKLGMNRGEKRQVERLVEADINAYYVILVKPCWDKTRSSMYLFTDRKARERATWIAGNLADKDFFTAAMYQADRSTSTQEAYAIKYQNSSINNYVKIGSIAETSEVMTGNLLEYINNPGRGKRMTEEDLLELKL